MTDVECTSARELISAAVDDELPAGQLRLLDDHLEVCPLCRGYAERVSALDADRATPWCRAAA